MQSSSDKQLPTANSSTLTNVEQNMNILVATSHSASLTNIDDVLTI